MTKNIDLLICNSSKLLTLSCKEKPKTGNELQELSIVDNGAVAVKDGLILETGSTKDLLKKI